jgi:predicted dinucleotide-binding enzyme
VDIGIIGSGNIGGTSARLLAGAGHRVLISNSRGPETLVDQATGLGPEVSAVTAEEAARRGEVVLVAIPFGRYRDLPAAALDGRIVIDATNYYPDRDGTVAELEDGSTTSSELVAAHLAGARVVKAFNTIYFVRLGEGGRPPGDPERLALPIVGDDEEAKRVVAGLIDEMGFDAVDHGGLAQGAAQQPGTLVYATDLTAAQLRERLGIG